jgi:hypothetical protein
MKRVGGFGRSWIFGVTMGAALAMTGGAAAAGEPAGASTRKLQPLTSGPAPDRASKLTTEAARLLMAGKPQEALEQADRAIAASPKSAWAHYQRAVALATLRRWNDAIAAYNKAEGWFTRGDDWGRSVAIWGRAEAQREAGYCEDAKTSFNQYIALVAARDRTGADQAFQQATACLTALERQAPPRPDDGVAPPPVGSQPFEPPAATATDESQARKSPPTALDQLAPPTTPVGRIKPPAGVEPPPIATESPSGAPATKVSTPAATEPRPPEPATPPGSPTTTTPGSKPRPAPGTTAPAPVTPPPVVDPEKPAASAP